MLGGESTPKTEELMRVRVGTWRPLGKGWGDGCHCPERPDDFRAASVSSCPVVTCGPWPHGCLLLLKIFSLHIWVKISYH